MLLKVYSFFCSIKCGYAYLQICYSLKNINSKMWYWTSVYKSVYYTNEVARSGFTTLCVSEQRNQATSSMDITDRYIAQPHTSA